VLQWDAAAVGEEQLTERTELVRRAVDVSTPCRLAHVTVRLERCHGRLDVAGRECALVIADDAAFVEIGVGLQQRWADRVAAGQRPGAEVDAQLDDASVHIAVGGEAKGSPMRSRAGGGVSAVRSKAMPRKTTGVAAGATAGDRSPSFPSDHATGAYAIAVAILLRHRKSRRQHGRNRSPGRGGTSDVLHALPDARRGQAARDARWVAIPTIRRNSTGGAAGDRAPRGVVPTCVIHPTISRNWA
jgi:hypothetical protein